MFVSETVPLIDLNHGLEFVIVVARVRTLIGRGQERLTASGELFYSINRLDNECKRECAQLPVVR